MSWTVLAPATAGVILGLAAGRLQRRLQPRQATVAFTLLAASSALAVVAAVAVVALLFISTVPAVAQRVPLCAALMTGHHLPTWLGAGAVAASAAMAGSVCMALRRLRVHRDLGLGQSFLVLPTDEPAAFAVPGDPGCVVVSTGMLRALDGDERRVLLAHEQAHLTRRHHRYLWVTALATSMVPVLRSLDRRVRFATERWADEDAAVAVAVGDRRLVARALCRAALAQDGYPGPALSLAGLGVRARVDALLDDPKPTQGARLVSTFALTAFALSGGGLVSSLQLHHLASFATHVCEHA